MIGPGDSAGGAQRRPDFFVSYTQVDRGWAEWIAWLLEEAGHRVLVQAWDMVPGSNWVDRMDQGVDRAAAYLQVHGQPAAARPLAERALWVAESVYGPDHPDVVLQLTGLVLVLCDLGELAAVRPLVERALRITESVHPRSPRRRRLAKTRGPA